MKQLQEVFEKYGLVFRPKQPGFQFGVEAYKELGRPSIHLFTEEETQEAVRNFAMRLAYINLSYQFGEIYIGEPERFDQLNRKKTMTESIFPKEEWVNFQFRTQFGKTFGIKVVGFNYFTAQKIMLTQKPYFGN